MERKRKLLLFKISAAVAGLILLIAFMAGCPGGKIRPDATAAVTRGIPVTETDAMFTVRVEPRAQQIDVVGTVQARERTHLSARISAYVEETLVSAGQQVSRNQLLFRLDDRELREQLAAAEAGLRQAETEFERTRRLREADAATEQALTAAETGLNTARAGTEQIRVMLTYTEIKAPYDGIISERTVETGDLANPGQVLARIYDPSAMRLEVHVPVRFVDRIAIGDELPVTLDWPAASYTGVVAEMLSEIDPLTRTRLVKLALPEETTVLPGTFGRAWISGASEAAIPVPQTAIVNAGQLALAYVVENGFAIPRLIKTGRVYRDRIDVLAGLADGDVILLNPQP